MKLPVKSRLMRALLAEAPLQVTREIGTSQEASSYNAQDGQTFQKILSKQHAQLNKPDSLLCTAILGLSGNLLRTLGLRPRAILGCLRQPRHCMCRGGYLLISNQCCLEFSWGTTRIDVRCLPQLWRTALLAGQSYQRKTTTIAVAPCHGTPHAFTRVYSQGHLPASAKHKPAWTRTCSRVTCSSWLCERGVSRCSSCLAMSIPLTIPMPRQCSGAAAAAASVAGSGWLMVGSA